MTEPTKHLQNAIDKIASGLTHESPGDLLEYVNISRKGLNYVQYKNLLLMDDLFELKDWARILNINVRTLERYKKQKKRLDALQSDRLLEVSQLLERGLQVFDGYEDFKEWLNTKNSALGNQSPAELLDTNFGIELIKDELTRIEHGILA